MLRLTGGAVLAGAFMPHLCLAETREQKSPGVVSGDVDGQKAGAKVLADGGNAIDAVIAAALVTCVTSNNRCGIGGYGGHMTIAPAGGKKITCIDYNSAAPASARPDMFPLDEKSNVIDRVNFTGWLAAGVPGTLAGMQLALDRFGTRSFRELATPAIALARDGFPANRTLAEASSANAALLRKCQASAKLFLKDNEPLKEGELFRNPELAQTLAALAERNSVDSFYRGDIAQGIAADFKKHGGLVTEKDLAEYRAREVSPLELEWNGFTIYTAPLTAGGITVLQALKILKSMDWSAQPAGLPKSHARLEALRAAWRDRLALLGDPAKVEVPMQRLLSSNYARSEAELVAQAVKEKRPLRFDTNPAGGSGTMHLSAVDARGNMVSMTLTHGAAFGSSVTVEGLGIVLGHGMSRFNARPGHPNSVGPGKRPLHNMCPTIVTKRNRPVLAIGGAGGRYIPNSIFDVLINYVALGRTMEEALRAPRLSSEGDMNLLAENNWPAEELEFYKSMGYQPKSVPPGALAHVSAVSFDPRNGECKGTLR